MSEEKSGSGLRIAIVVGVAIAMPVLYVLSLGPAIWIYDASPSWVQTALEAVYYPLQWLAEQNEMLSDIVVWYAELWR